ncbi:MAG: hypothetical protein ACR2KE_05225 [Candidatus Nanopelagicales bacterium]
MTAGASDKPHTTVYPPDVRRALGRASLWVVLVVIIIVSIQLALPDVVTVGPTWLVPFIELIGIPIVGSLMFLAGKHQRLVSWTMTAFLILLVLASVMNAILLLLSLLGGFTEQGGPLLFAGFGVLIINVLSFGLVYWWIDGGGPYARATGTVTHPDFLFPQQGMEGQEDWRPGLLDYLFTAYTNIIAFSPTDTMPLSKRVKILFTVQSSTAVLTIVVTLSRAINLIPGGTPPS